MIGLEWIQLDGSQNGDNGRVADLVLSRLRSAGLASADIAATAPERRGLVDICQIADRPDLER